MKLFFCLSGTLSAELIDAGARYSVVENPLHNDGRMIWLFALTREYTPIVRRYFESKKGLPNGIRNIIDALEREAENDG